MPVPPAVPLATLVAGLGMLGGAVSGLHDLGGQLHGAAAARQQRVELVRVSDDRPDERHCRRPRRPADDVPPAPSSLQ